MFPLKLSNFKVFIFKDCESTSFCFQTFNIKKQSFHNLLKTLELNDGQKSIGFCEKKKYYKYYKYYKKYIIIIYYYNYIIIIINIIKKI